MSKIPQWALWGVIGGFGGLLVGYLLYLATDPPRYQSDLGYWLEGESTLLWIVIGAIVGALLSFLLLSRKPPSTPT